MRPEEAEGNSSLSQPRCEIEKTPLEGECQRPGEVRYKVIILVCGPHAALLQLEDRAQAVLGSVFQRNCLKRATSNAPSVDLGGVGRPKWV
jgi:hypothetical protein